MIYTLTLNPSIDYMTDVTDLRIGGTNRAVGERLRAGGKGINVSIMLRNLGVTSVALGFVAGFTGEEICRGVREQGIEEHFIRLSNGCSRINIKLRTPEETEINGIGPVIGDEDMNALHAEFDRMTDGDIIVMSGSAPSGAPSSIYADLMRRVSDKDIKVVIDAAGELLSQTLSLHPFLIKPNNHELAAVTGISPDGGAEEMVRGAVILRGWGARNVLVSMGDKGAVMVDEDDNVRMLPAPVVTPVNTVGAGDSMVAGFLYEYLQSTNAEQAFRTAIRAGSASAASEGFATSEEVRRISL